jgi:hypothetical protein
MSMARVQVTWKSSKEPPEVVSQKNCFREIALACVKEASLQIPVQKKGAKQKKLASQNI